jgi:hypothetical protein
MARIGRHARPADPSDPRFGDALACAFEDRVVQTLGDCPVRFVLLDASEQTAFVRRVDE